MKTTPPPDRRALEDLYVAQHLTTRQIGELYGVTRRTVSSWLRSYGIDVRPAGRGLVAQGKRQPTREELIQLVHEQRLSYQEIAEMFGATTPQSVSYWLGKYDVPHRSPEMTKVVRWYREKEQPQLPTKAEFLRLYEQGLSVPQIAHDLNLQADMLYDFCQKEGIERRPHGWKNGIRYECKDGHKVLSIYEQRVDDWLYEHNISHIVEPPLPFDRRYRSDFLANGWYIEIWGVTGNPAYHRRKALKTAQYKQHGLPLIEIYAYHFDKRRNSPWERRLKQVLQPQGPQQISLELLLLPY